MWFFISLALFAAIIAIWALLTKRVLLAGGAFFVAVICGAGATPATKPKPVDTSVAAQAAAPTGNVTVLATVRPAQPHRKNPPKPQPATERGRLANLVSVGNEIFDAASRIVEKTPHTTAAAAIVGSDSGPAGLFYKREQAYYARLQTVDAAPFKDPSLRPVDRTLLLAEPFLYEAVVAAVGNCNRGDGRANLRVARATLDRSALLLAKADESDWSAPKIEESNVNLCTESLPPGPPPESL